MSEAKVMPQGYIDFLIVSPVHFTATEAAKVQPDYPDPPAHDALTRLLHRLEPDSTTLWTEAQTQVQLIGGVLVIDDSTFDKPYARDIELVTRHWSGKHHQVVRGINLVMLLWTDGDRAVPCDYRLYDKADNLTKNDPFAAMLTTARDRGFQPRCVVFDGWYSSLANLKLVHSFQWRSLTRLRSDRRVNQDRHGLRALKDTAISVSGTEVWLKGYGLVKVFGIVAPDGDVEHWATNDLTMTQLERLQLKEFSWQVEHYHRAIKQCTGVERCQCRAAKAQHNHVELALRAFLRLESHCDRVGVSWYEAKKNLIRDAVRVHLDFPTIRLIPRATAGHLRLLREGSLASGRRYRLTNSFAPRRGVTSRGLLVRPVRPHVPQPGECERCVVGHAEVDRLFHFPHRSRLVEPVRRDQAPLLTEGVAERRLFHIPRSASTLCAKNRVRLLLLCNAINTQAESIFRGMRGIRGMIPLGWLCQRVA